MSRGVGCRRGRGAGSYSNRLNADGECIDKIFEKMILLRLEEFRDGPETELKLEPMNREQRKFTHHVAGRLDLKSHSTGNLLIWNERFVTSAPCSDTP
uniref:R3H domain-containing protein n=1 Tax=Ascaris lumbricoides TaxID=6252 RepID=A0A9J2PII6_ASCLU